MIEPVNWNVGEEIGIAPTNYTGNESEFRKIAAISGDKKTITLNEPLTYRHFSEVETYGSEEVPMRCEVALLSRNIVI